MDILDKLRDLQKLGPLSRYFGRQTGEETIAEICRLRREVEELRQLIRERLDVLEGD